VESDAPGPLRFGFSPPDGVDSRRISRVKPAKPDIFRSVKNSRLEAGRCQAAAFYVTFSSKLNPEYQSLAMFTYRWRPILE
jgi:hypothetical protein